MDVRCESCGTEYELDDSKLKAGGVTVKCANCGHMFKIRRRPGSGSTPAPRPQARRSRPNTQQGVTRPGSAPSRRPEERPRTNSSPLRAPTSSTGPVKKKRTWLVRDRGGEVKTCRELAKLQQWIVEGTVSRESQISRNGKTWKPLGEISELAMFFDVADEAKAARSGVSPLPEAPPPPPQTARPGSGSVPPLRAPRASSAAPPPQPPPRPPPSAPAERKPVPMSGPPSGPALVANRDGLSIPEELDQPQTGNWAAAGPQQVTGEGGSGPSGPVGGLSKSIPTADVAFAAGNKALRRVETEPPPDFTDDPFAMPARRGTALWVALGSVLVIGSALAVVYLFVFRDKSGDEPTTEPMAEVVVDAGGPVAETIEPPAPADDPATTARTALLGDSQLDLEELSKQLEGSAADNAELTALRSRIEGALAQHFMDEALLADSRERGELRKQAKKRATAAQVLAKAALQADKNSVEANVAMADATRLRGRKASEVRRWLRKARALDAGDREAMYVEAMIDLRENKLTRGTRALRKLSADADNLGDVRPFYRLAVLDVAGKKHVEARDNVKRVLAMQAGHAGATALLTRIDAETSVVTTDPMPPEDDGDGDSGGSSGSMSYDSLLSRAEKRAESGNCKSAMQLYQKALDVNPVGVGALTGLGYCHIDARQFASAQAQFRAALSISPRYQEALLGVAEAYQQQGLKAQAVKAYQRFLDEHPGSPRAAQVKRQIDRLGGAEPPQDKPPTDPPADKPPGDEPPADPPPADPPPSDPAPADPPAADPPADDKSDDGPTGDSASGGDTAPSDGED